MKRKTFLTGITALTLFSSLMSPVWADQKIFRVGATPGPHAQIVEEAAKVAAKDGLKVKVIEFSNYVLPNQALATGELDANSFQHLPYLNTQMQKQGLELIAVAQSIAFPMGIYSQKVKDLQQTSEGARVGLPNDPSNGARALLLLQNAGLIKLKPDFSVIGTVQDVTENPHKLKFVEVDAAMLPRMLSEVDLAVIPTNYALDAGLNPTKDALFKEPADSPYTGVIAVRLQDKDSPEVVKFVKAYRSPEVKAFIDEKFKGAILPTW